jgi:hypothetical protein
MLISSVVSGVGSNPTLPSLSYKEYDEQFVQVYVRKERKDEI